MDQHRRAHQHVHEAPSNSLELALKMNPTGQGFAGDSMVPWRSGAGFIFFRAKLLVAFTDGWKTDGVAEACWSSWEFGGPPPPVNARQRLRACVGGVHN